MNQALYAHMNNKRKMKQKIRKNKNKKIQICSTIELVYNHACFHVHVYHWIYLPHLGENIHPLCF
jgi:hypothetical protein